MSSNAHNTGSRLLRREGDLINRGLLKRGWSRQGVGEKLFVDLELTGLRGTTRLPR